MAAIQNQISNFSRQTQVGSSWWASVLNICKHKYELGPHIKMEPLIMISRLIKVKSVKKKKGGWFQLDPMFFLCDGISTQCWQKEFWFLCSRYQRLENGINGSSFDIYHTFFQVTFSKDIARDRQRPFTHYSMDTLHPRIFWNQKIEIQLSIWLVYLLFA